MIILPLCGLSCKQRLARFSVKLKFKIGRVWQFVSHPGYDIGGEVVRHLTYLTIAQGVASMFSDVHIFVVLKTFQCVYSEVQRANIKER